jgi:hypothetical protein
MKVILNSSPLSNILYLNDRLFLLLLFLFVFFANDVTGYFLENPVIPETEKRGPEVPVNPFPLKF